MPGAGADLFWQEASALQLPGIAAKPACAYRQGHSQEGETPRKAEETTARCLLTTEQMDRFLWFIVLWFRRIKFPPLTSGNAR